MESHDRQNNGASVGLKNISQSQRLPCSVYSMVMAAVDDSVKVFWSHQQHQKRMKVFIEASPGRYREKQTMKARYDCTSKEELPCKLVRKPAVDGKGVVV